MLERIKQIVKDYKLDVGTIREQLTPPRTNFEVSIALGSNEGYYVNVIDYHSSYFLRIHDKDEALKALGCLLILLPNN